MTKIIYPGTRAGITDIKTIAYNDGENNIITTDPELRKVYERRDFNGNILEIKAWGRQTREEDKLTYTYTYDELNRKTSFTDAMGIITRYSYDERDLLIEQHYGNESGSDRMEYDDFGRLIKKTDRKGQVSTCEYDEMGRNTKVIHFLNSTAYESKTPVRNVQTIYDNRGNAVRIDNEHLIEYYMYDAANRVTTLQQIIKDPPVALDETLTQVIPGYGDNSVLAFHYTYNACGMVTSMTYPDGSVYEYSYDPILAQLSEIAEGTDHLSVAPFVTGLTYNKSGVVTLMEYANNTSQEWEFDNRKRISRINITGPQGVIEDLSYTLNGSGDILAINDNKYEYDEFNRIIKAVTKLPENDDTVKLVQKYFGTYQSVGENNGLLYIPEADLNTDGRINGEDHRLAVSMNMANVYDTEYFTYDKNGNRKTLDQNGDSYEYTCGIRNRLEKITRRKRTENAYTPYAEYEYDANGNTTKRTIHTDTGDIEVIDFEYDTMNQLVKTTENSDVTEYLYDNAGNRFIKKDPDGSVTLHLRHGQITVAMDVQTGGPDEAYKAKVNRYILSGDLLAGRVTTTIATDGSVTVNKSWYHLDHLNSTKCITDEDGEVEVNYTYRAFGEQLRRLNADGEGTEDKAKYSYGGKELDDETNLYYFNARYYDATIGQFINVDPVQDEGNWYVYCGNNPLNMVDPTGLNPGNNQPDESIEIDEANAVWDMLVDIFGGSDSNGNDLIMDAINSPDNANSTHSSGTDCEDYIVNILNDAVANGLSTEMEDFIPTHVDDAIHEFRESLISEPNFGWNVVFMQAEDRETYYYNNSNSRGDPPFGTASHVALVYKNSDGSIDLYHMGDTIPKHFNYNDLSNLDDNFIYYSCDTNDYYFYPIDF